MEVLALLACGRSWAPLRVGRFVRQGRVVLRGAVDDDSDDASEAARIAAFRARLMKGGLDAVASAEEPEADDDEGPTEWARFVEKPVAGTVLVGAERYFFADAPDASVRDSLARVGLPPDAAERIPQERQAALTPVVLLLDSSSTKRVGFAGVLLGRRSGYMMGDFTELNTNGFVVQPLWIGGPSMAPSEAYRTAASADDAAGTGIVAIHPYRTVTGATALTDDGLFVGGDWSSATMLVEKGMANPFRFRLFAQATTWKPGDLEREIASGAWRVAQVSTELLLKDRDRGARPLPLDILDSLLD